MEAVEEVEVEEEQGEVEQEVAAAEEEAAEEEAEVGALRAGRQQQLAIPADRPGWSVQEGTAAQASLVASHSQSYQLLSSLKNLLLRYRFWECIHLFCVKLFFKYFFIWELFIYLIVHILSNLWTQMREIKYFYLVALDIFS